jgi:hypothetical protein
VTDVLPRHELDGLMEAMPGLDAVSPVAADVLAHLCAGPAACRAIATVAECCDATDDAYVVICPGCGARFGAGERDLADLRRWTDAEGNALVCGIRWD